jgi:uncharacterized membrane protein
MIQQPSSQIALRITKFILPIIIGFSVFTIIGFTLTYLGEEATWAILWPLFIAYFFPPFGKETIIPLGIGLLENGLTISFLNLYISPGQVNPLLMALSIAFVDIIVAWFLVWNYDLAKKIPLIGTFITKIETRGKSASTKYSWIKPLRFIGIILFVMVPFQGSGGLVGSIIGRLIGMKPWNTFYAISIGAIVGCLLIAFFAQAFLIFTELNTLLTLLLLVGIVICVLIYLIIKKYRKKQHQKNKAI